MIIQFHEQFLERSPEPVGFEHYLKSIINGIMTIDEFKNEILNSEEFEMVNPYYKIIKTPKPSEIQPGFFDKYDTFLKTSVTGVLLNRLNTKYKVIIENNRKLFQGKTILDIASHDGRWSFAALKNGAKKVIGIEAREHLINFAKQNMKKLNVDKNSFVFIHGDVNEEIQKIEPNSIDTIFCQGFFYHTLDHSLLLKEFKRLNSEFLIIDTHVSTSNEPIIQLIHENADNEAAAIKNKFNSSNNVLVGWPSKSALKFLLENYGFDFKFLNWRNTGIKNWSHLGDYYTGKRMTITARNLKKILNS